MGGLAKGGTDKAKNKQKHTRMLLLLSPDLCSAPLSGLPQLGPARVCRRRRAKSAFGGLPPVHAHGGAPAVGAAPVEAVQQALRPGGGCLFAGEVKNRKREKRLPVFFFSWPKRKLRLKKNLPNVTFQKYLRRSMYFSLDPSSFYPWQKRGTPSQEPSKCSLLKKIFSLLDSGSLYPPKNVDAAL